MTDQPIPEHVITALAQVRETVQANTPSRSDVVFLAERGGHFAAAYWLHAAAAPAYQAALNEMERRMGVARAQQLAPDQREIIERAAAILHNPRQYPAWVRCEARAALLALRPAATREGE